MADPQTTNVLLSIPAHGTDVNSWDVPLNADFTALDGYLGGIQNISAGSSPITLTSPSGTPTAGAGPTQAQNAILRVSGALTAPVQITLPLPGPIIIENLTTGNFILSFRAIGSGQVIAVDQGEIQSIYNDGMNVRFVSLGGRIGAIEIWGGLTAMPAWVNACTVPPYLLNDGSIYSFATYPYLGKRFGAAFGGNGVTTFGVPDHQGRIPLVYDGTGTRITAAGCGLNGALLGAVLDEQVITLGTGQVPNLNLSVTYNDGSRPATTTGNITNARVSTGGTGSLVAISDGLWETAPANTGNTANGGGLSHPNVQPSQVTGISVTRAA